MDTKNKIIIYTSPDNQIEVTVKIQDETVWLTLNQIAEFFGRDKSVISRHFRSIFSSGELSQEQTVAKNATVQIEGKKEVIRQIEYYNLDAIISVGYRVNSTRATQFRQWATARLKEYLVQGYSINQKRLDELQKTIQIISEKSKGDLSLVEARGFLEIISTYTESFILLNQYDAGSLEIDGSPDITYIIEYSEAHTVIGELRSKLMEKWEASDLFGNEKDQSFTGILSSIIATFDGAYLYPTIEEQAAHLLYFIIKDHPFSDGNKRIGAFLFVWFLEKNRHRFRRNGDVKINESGLVSLALLIAQSDPKEKEMMIRLVINLINT